MALRPPFGEKASQWSCRAERQMRSRHQGRLRAMMPLNRLFTLCFWGVLTAFSSSTLFAQATVTLTVPDSAAAEAGQDPASFTATRTTDAGTDLNLRVYCSGAATRRPPISAPSICPPSTSPWFT
jgi:hypothetical protein